MLDEIESRLNSLELKCRRPVAHLLAGEYRSIFRGRGIEFDDVRAYQAGDDIRSMDWKVTARTGEPHIKRFIEEREQCFYLLVDVSASMLHGQAGRKRQTTAEIGSLLTLAATQNQDRVGLLLFTDQIEHVVPAGKSRRHALRIMDKLLNFIPEGKQTGYSQVLNRFGHMARKHSVVFVISDFLSEGYMDELGALACHHDVNAIHVLDHPQFESDLSGMIRVEDAETGSQRVIDLDQQKTLPHTHRSRVRQQMQDTNVNLLELEVGGDCVAALTDFFASRQRQINDNTGG
jgi:uncharacterized protein (DUF58 family)